MRKSNRLFRNEHSLYGKGKVKIYMYEYIEKILTELPLDMKGVSKMPAATHLFYLNDKVDKLDKDKAQLFHHLVVKLLYLCHRSRQDVQTAVAFLGSRVNKPTWMTTILAKLVHYLRGSRELTLTIEPSDPQAGG